MDYDRIAQEMAARAQPTVGDALALMRRESGPLPPRRDLEQEVAHYVTRRSYHPTEAGIAIPFYIALRGVGRGELPTVGRQIEDLCVQQGVDIPSKRDIAVNFAAGLYLRDKVAQFHQTGSRYKPYAEQQQLAAHYPQSDHTPEAGDGRAPVTLQSPEALVTLSREEWRAISHVATGLNTPEQTPYPERLAPIREALAEAGLAYNLRQAYSAAPQRAATKSVVQR